jgi:hypothetical protein
LKNNQVTIAIAAGTIKLRRRLKNPSSATAGAAVCFALCGNGCLPAGWLPAAVGLFVFFAMQHKYTFLACSVQKKGPEIQSPL